MYFIGHLWDNVWTSQVHEASYLSCLTGGGAVSFLRKPEFPLKLKAGGGGSNKMLSTTRTIWKDNKATITHATHQLCVTVAAVA